MYSPFKNIIVIGATGSIGSVMLEALIREPYFTVTVLRRKSSKGRPDARVHTLTIDDSYPHDELLSAFTGQDAVVNCMTTLAVSDQFKIIDAAVEARVRRYVASEYGLDNNNPDARALSSVFREKGEIQDYLRSKQTMEWMGIACGMWIKWSATHEFLGMHVKEKRFTFWDDGTGMFSTSTEANTALALVNCLRRKWKETANTLVRISDFAINQKMLLEALQRITGESFKTETVSTDAFIREKQALVRTGDKAAVYALVEVGFVSGKYGGHLEKHGEIMNELLELPKQSLDDVVRAAVAAVQ